MSAVADLLPDPVEELEPRQPSSWSPVDLTDAVNGVGRTEPSLLFRSDRIGLLYAARVHWFQGESESLKTWFAMVGVEQMLTAQTGSVLWIDFEDDDRGIVGRLRALGVTGEVLLDQERFVYLRPDEPLEDRHGTALAGAIDLGELLDQSWDLVVIDGVTEAMTTEGLSLIDNADVARWMRLLPRRFAEAGAAVAVIDHVVKNREGQGRYAIGGQHKLAGVSGAVYRVTNTRPLSRALADPVTGSSKIEVAKDRPGWVRAQAVGETVAVLEITAYPDGGVTASLVAPGEATTAPPEPLMLDVLAYLATYDGAAKSAIETGVEGKAETIRGVLRYLVAQEWVSVRKEGNAHRHYVTDAGRQQLNPEEDS